MKDKYIGEKTDKEHDAIREEMRILVRYLSPDDDLARAITMDELLLGVKEDLKAIFKNSKK